MTERSRFWNSTGPGDATEAPYDAPTEFAQVLMALGGGHGLTNRGGIWPTHQNMEPQVPGANTLRVKAGTAQVYGTWYETDADVDITIPTPAGSTRNDLIVIRKSWAAQTCLLTRVAGAEGGGVPTLTQVVGTTYDIPICSVAITTGAVMTVTDRRQLLISAGWVVGEEYKIPNGGSRRVLFDEATFGGWLFVMNDVGTGAIFFVRGSINDVKINVESEASQYTIVLGTASRTNVDWNATEYQIQNNTGAERKYRVWLLRGF